MFVQYLIHDVQSVAFGEHFVDAFETNDSLFKMEVVVRCDVAKESLMEFDLVDVVDDQKNVDIPWFVRFDDGAEQEQDEIIFFDLVDDLLVEWGQVFVFSFAEKFISPKVFHESEGFVMVFIVQAKIFVFVSDNDILFDEWFDRSMDQRYVHLESSCRFPEREGFGHVAGE